MIRIWKDDHALEKGFRSSDFFFRFLASSALENKSELQGSKPQQNFYFTDTLITRISALFFMPKAEIQTYDSHLAG